MELTISQKELFRGLQRSHAVADRKSSMAILSNVLLTTEGKSSLRLAATDLYLGIATLVDAKVKKQGSVAIAARTLFDIVKALPPGEVTLIAKDGGLHLSCGKVKYKIPFMSGEDFPPLPHPGSSTFSSLRADHISELISLTSYSMSTDDTRPHLAGTWFETNDGKALMVTTDGHRLSKAEVAIDSKEELAMLVPHKGVMEIKRLLDDVKSQKDDEAAVEVSVAGGHAFFKRSDVLLSIKLTDEKFPPYEKVIPKKQTKKMIAARNIIIEALRRISLVAADRSGGIQFHLTPGQLKIKSQNPDVGEGVEEIEIDYEGDALSIGFNARYLLDVLSSLTSDEVVFELNGELDPGIIKPAQGETDFVGVIMPMRV